jgi:hypothetical protein
MDFTTHPNAHRIFLFPKCQLLTALLPPTANTNQEIVKKLFKHCVREMPPCMQCQSKQETSKKAIKVTSHFTKKKKKKQARNL